MRYLELFKLGEKMMKAWDSYSHSGSVETRKAYESACAVYEAAELVCDELPEDHMLGLNVAG